MEVNKDEAERCRNMGAAALKRGDYARAEKLLDKSIRLYPLPGVEALLQQVKREMNNQNTNAQSHSNGGSTYERSHSTPPQTSSPAPPVRQTSSASMSGGTNGRAYSQEQVRIVESVLKAKEGGRGAHYRVLGLERDANESQIKKAYRKLSLKVHPDKNSAPHSDEAFKAVGLAYATLSDTEKRSIYDRYGDEDPDNRGGGGMRPGGMHMRPGQEVSPEDIFNMFFGGGGMGGMGGMHAGGPGVHFYSNGFGGPGMHFRTQGPRRPAGRRPGSEAETSNPHPINVLMQFLPLLMILLFSFLRYGETDTPSGSMPGENKHFTLKPKAPFINPMKTKLVNVKGIPYYVTNNFSRTVQRDMYSLSRVERMVQDAYENFLVHECQEQRAFKRKLKADAVKEGDEFEHARKEKAANDFELSRCKELVDLFPDPRRTMEGLN